MRRAILALGSTVAGLAALLSFKTHVPALPARRAGTAAAPGSGGPSAGAGSADMAGAGHASRPARSSPAPHRHPLERPHGHRHRGRHHLRAHAGPAHAGRPEHHQGDRAPAHRRRRESNQIDANAIPKLINETLAAQSARINAVSGASYTSAGYPSRCKAPWTRPGMTAARARRTRSPMAGRERLRHAEPVMGTVVSFDVPAAAASAPLAPGAALAALGRRHVLAVPGGQRRQPPRPR